MPVVIDGTTVAGAACPSGVNDPYFTSSESYDETMASTWTDPAANELGDAANNYYYYVRGADGCASTPGQTVGEFDFALTPGAP